MNNKGQVAIIVLLVSAVMLSLGLSMSKRETTQIKINTNDEMLKKAFDTAESGINYYLGTGGTSYASPGGDSFAKITASNIGVGATINFGEYIPLGSSENYWLVNHLSNGDIGTSYYLGASVDVCSSNYSGEVEATLLYTIGVKRSMLYIINNCVAVDMVGSPILLVITPVATGGKFYIESDGGVNFSAQGIDISSEGRAGTASIDAQAFVNKDINIRLRYKLPGFMTSGMVAEGSILSD
jgi:hypothetical protein